MKTETIPDIIDQTRVHEGYEFTTYNARGRYIRTDLAKRAQWLNENLDKWRSVREVHEEAARWTNSDDVIATDQSDASLSNLDERNSVNGVAGSAAVPSVDVAPSSELLIAATEIPTTLAPSPSEIVESGLTLNGRTCLSTEQFALMLGVSKRTLYRFLQDGKGPPRVKISGVYYELETVLKWSSERGHAIKQNICPDEDE